jgi:hypothetical protein
MRFSAVGSLRIGNIDCSDHRFFGSSHCMGTPRLSAHFGIMIGVAARPFVVGRRTDHLFNRHGKE